MFLPPCPATNGPLAPLGAQVTSAHFPMVEDGAKDANRGYGDPEDVSIHATGIAEHMHGEVGGNKLQGIAVVAWSGRVGHAGRRGVDGGHGEALEREVSDGSRKGRQEGRELTTRGVIYSPQKLSGSSILNDRPGVRVKRG